jgi:mannose-6-phosphate isomerase-like protein (cupin superfamily)
MRRVEKPWGHEEIWAETSRYVGKILYISEGHRLSLQHHEVKDETIRVSSGVLALELEDDSGVLRTLRLTAGESAHIRPGHKHRMAAITDVQVLEVSTPELDDVVRHSDDYGRVPDGSI